MEESRQRLTDIAAVRALFPELAFYEARKRHEARIRNLTAITFGDLERYERWQLLRSSGPSQKSGRKQCGW